MNIKVICFASIALMLMGSAFSGEFTPDDKTLFLCHFNDKIDADYAKGTAGHLTGNAGITQGSGGKYGEGLICRKSMVATASGIDAPYSQIDFPMAGNINLKEGTLEFWTKMDFPRKLSKGQNNLYYFVDIPSNLKDKAGNNKRIAIVLVESKGDSPETVKVFHYFMRPNEAITSIVAWQPNEWHHVAITWNETETSLFLDGKKIGSMPLNGGLLDGEQAACRESFWIGGLWNDSNDKGPEGVVDEFRISSVVRYLNSFTP